MKITKSSRKKSAVSLELARLRRHLNETQEVFAQRMKVNPVTVARWETTHPPSRQTLERIAEVAEAAKYPRSAVFRAPYPAGTVAMDQPFSPDAIGQPTIRAPAFQTPLPSIKSEWIEALIFQKKGLDFLASISDDLPGKPEATEALLKVFDWISVRMHEDIREALFNTAGTKRGEQGEGGRDRDDNR